MVRLLLCCGLAAMTVAGGCARRDVTIAQTLPQESYATPWILEGRVWSGTFDEALPALGEDGPAWRAFSPVRVWLAVYHHDTHPLDQIVVRVFAFDSARQARQAYDFVRPGEPTQIEVGDAGCWTDDGVLVLWGKAVVEVFSRGVSGIATPEQAMYVLALIEKRMPRELPANPH